MKAVLFSIGLLLTTNACTQVKPAELWLELNILRSFDNPTLIKFRIVETAGIFSVEETAFTESGNQNTKIPPSSRRHALSDSNVATMQSILRKIESAQPKAAVGFDGSSWELRITKPFQRDFSLWTPTFEKEARQTGSIVELGEFLWVLSERKVDNTFY